VLELQCTRLIPVMHLVAVATLSRYLHQSDAPPLTWIRHAIECSTADGFRIEMDSSVSALRPLLEKCGFQIAGTTVSGTFSTDALTPLVDSDMLTRNLGEPEATPTPRDLVARALCNDALLLRLLDNPRISSAPGVVQMIATTSRSLAVLQKIARTQELYTGHANNGVPAALLRNPTHVPLTQLRQFINSRYTPFSEMKAILNNPYGIRRDVYSEIKQYVEQRYR
jgi:hypothetical protein